MVSFRCWVFGMQNALINKLRIDLIVKNYLSDLLIGKSDKPMEKEEIYETLTIGIFSILGIVAVAMYGVFCLNAGFYTLFAYQIFSILYFVVVLLLNRKHIHAWPEVSMPLLIAVNDVLWTYWIGPEASTIMYNYVGVVAVFVFFTQSTVRRYLMAILLFISLMICMSFDNTYNPPYIMPNIHILSYINQISAFVMLAICLFLSKYVMKIAETSYKERIQLEEVRSRTDALTRVWNRRHFEEMATQINDGFRLHVGSVALLDIDYFKQINDTYGHDAGDQVLVHFASTINNRLKETDLLIRWGGEEFLVIMFDSKADDCVQLLETIKKDLSKIEIRLPDKEKIRNIQFTAGVCETGTIKIHEAIKKADGNLYKGKSTTRNCIVYDA